MEYILLITGFICVISGIIGSLLPAIPGAPLGWLGLLLISITNGVETNYWLLGTTLIVVLAVVVLDYTIPAQGTKRFGGSKYGIWGTNIGLIFGLIAPIPFGVIIGPFAGALIGELLYNSEDLKRAVKAATGSLLGFLASTFVSFVVSIIFFGLFLNIVWNHSAIWF